MKPMLAGKFDPIKIKQQFPLFGQPKLDGIRMIINEGVGLSRSLKPIPNKFIQEWVRSMGRHIHGFDGELMVGDPTAKDVYRKTNSGVMSQDGEPDFKYHVFDRWDTHRDPFTLRRSSLRTWERVMLRPPLIKSQERLVFTHSVVLLNEDSLDIYERNKLAEGYEGIILRGPNTLYKFGRATPTQGQLIKVKRFTDAEAVITGFEELMHNHNEATISETGHTVRSSHQDNKMPGNTLGKLVARFYWEDDHDEMEPVEIRIGTGYDQALRKEIWENQSAYLGKTVKFKYFAIGIKDKPRHPVFLGMRNPIDIGE